MTIRHSNRANVASRLAPLLAIVVVVVAVTSCRDSSAPGEPAGTKYVVTFSPSAPLAGDIVLARAQLVDEVGTGVRLAGRQVKWSTTAGVLSPASSLTDDTGSATTRLVLTSVAGVSYEIAVADDRGLIGQSNPFGSMAGPPRQYLVSTPNSSPQVGSTITVSAQLEDVLGNSIAEAGRVVTWSALGYRSATFLPATSSTDANGIARADLALGTAGNVSFAVLATDDHLLVGSSAPIRITPTAATQYIVAIDSSEANPPAGAAVAVFAQLADVYGNPVALQGHAVIWSVTGAGASLSATTATTESSGAAVVVLTTSSVVGATFTVSAADSGGLNGTTATITTQPQMSLSSIATGLDASSVCGTSAAGELWCWGDNSAGQLGNGTATTRDLPGRGGANVKLASVSVGSTFACGLTSAGAAYCWGNNTDGALGDGTLSSHSSPTPVASTVAFQSVSAGERHVCGVAVNGDAYCWGATDNGRLGAVIDGAVATAPVKVSGGLSFVAISAGGSHTCGIVKDGSAYCWGVNGSGQLGDNSQTSRTAPTQVFGSKSFTAISAGEAYTCGVVQGGAGYCWGSNSNGQLGLGTQGGSTKQPSAVVGNQLFSVISTGSLHTCALTTIGLAYCWGDNYMGELGDGGETNAKQPIPVVGGMHFATIGASGGDMTEQCGYYCYYYGYGTPSNAHSCGITTDGAAYCWGAQTSGQLGRGASVTSISGPARVAGQH